MRAARLILYLCCLISAAPAWAELKIYLGTVGFAPGEGLAGHSFVIAQDSALPDLLSVVFHYSVRNEDGSAISLKQAVFTSKESIFFIEKMRFLEFSMAYSQMLDRVISFHELNLTEAEAQKFLLALDADSKDPNFNREHPYNVFTNNCITRIVELLNNSAGTEKHIDLLYNSGLNQTQTLMAWRRTFANGILNRTPFNMDRVLDDHPISKGRVQIMERLSDTQVRFYLAIARRTDEAAKLCGWSQASTRRLNDILALSVRGEKGGVNALTEAAAQCPKANDPLSGVALILSRMFSTDDMMETRQGYLDLGQKLSRSRP